MKLLMRNEMAKMGIGYGSEYQLLRYMGRHRKLLNKKILDSIGSNGPIDWLDFGFSKSNPSNSDNELKGIQAFKKEAFYPILENNWKNFWPQTGSSQSWDAVFTIDVEWFFIEAKAHKSEIIDPVKKLEPNSRSIIQKSLEETRIFFGADSSEHWINSKYYQLCNRLAFVYFCQKNSIKAKIIYLDFINGFKKNGFFSRDNVNSIQEWKEIFNVVYCNLGLTNSKNLKDFLTHVYIDCNAGTLEE